MRFGGLFQQVGIYPSRFNPFAHCSQCRSLASVHFPSNAARISGQKLQLDEPLRLSQVRFVHLGQGQDLEVAFRGQELLSLVSVGEIPAFCPL